MISAFLPCLMNASLPIIHGIIFMYILLEDLWFLPVIELYIYDPFQINFILCEEWVKTILVSAVLTNCPSTRY